MAERATYETFDDTSPDGDNRITVHASEWRAQTFTPRNTHTIDQVKLRVVRQNSPGTVTVSIRAISGGDPTGSDLGSGTFDGNSIIALPPNSNNVFQAITIDPPVLVTVNVEYAIVVRAPSGDNTNRLHWHINVNGGYAEGRLRQSANGGATWSTPNDGDAFFAELGYRLGMIWVEE